LKNAYSRPKIRRFGDLTVHGQQYQRHPEKAYPSGQTSYDVQIVKIGPPVLAQLTLLPNPKSCASQCFSIGQCPFPWRYLQFCTPYLTHMVPWAHPTRHPEGPPESTSRTASRSVQPLLQIAGLTVATGNTQPARQTDRQTTPLRP